MQQAMQHITKSMTMIHDIRQDYKKTYRMVSDSGRLQSYVYEIQIRELFRGAGYKPRND